jgi:hypothetical protein
MTLIRLALAVLWCALPLLAKRESTPHKQEKVQIQVEVDSFVPEFVEYEE